jgi:hypothetical protein
VLLECHIFRRSSIRDGFQIALGLLRVRDYGFGILGDGAPAQKHYAGCAGGDFVEHVFSSIPVWFHRLFYIAPGFGSGGGSANTFIPAASLL